MLPRLSIKTRLMLMLLLVGAVSIFVVGAIGYWMGREALTSAAIRQLNSVRTSRTREIESYFESVRNEVETLGESPSIEAACRDCVAAFGNLQDQQIPDEQQEQLREYYREHLLKRLEQNIDGEPVLETLLPESPAGRFLQLQFLVGNENQSGEQRSATTPPDETEYATFHAEHHPWLNRIVERFGYYDLFLVDAKTGDIVYSASKKVDFGTNLLNGPHQSSNLGRIVHQLIDSPDLGRVAIADFAPYRPSYAEPAGFVATTVYDDSQFIGVLALQLSIDEINSVMTLNGDWESAGMGATGQAYIVGSDTLMRSISRKLIQDKEGYLKSLAITGTPEKAIDRIDRLETTVIQKPVRSAAVEEALAGRSGWTVVQDYQRNRLLTSYGPLKLEGLDWAIISEINQSEAYAPVEEFQRTLAISAAGLILVSTILTMLLASRFTRPIESLAAAANRVAEGDAEVVSNVPLHDEFGELANSFNVMVGNLRKQTAQVEEANRESEQLLLNVLPAPIAKRLKAGETDIADEIESVSVLFADVEGFSKWGHSRPAEAVMHMLNRLVTAFDEAADRHGVEKIKTIGDEYMAVVGLSVARLDHDKRIVDFARDLFSIVSRFNAEHTTDFALRVGVHSGTVVAGIVGRKKFLYDLWGETVRTANATKEACEPGHLLITDAVHARVHEIYPLQPFTPPGEPSVADRELWNVALHGEEG